MSFIQLVTITAKEGKGPEIRSYLEKVYEDVKVNEPATKKYHIGVDAKDKDVICLWEEYDNIAALEDVHRSGKPYQGKFIQPESADNAEFMSHKEELIAGFKIQRLDKVN